MPESWITMPNLYFPALAASPIMARMVTTPAPSPAPARGFWRRLRRVCVVCWALAAWALGSGAGAATCRVLAQPLLSPAQLQAELGCVRVLDIREGDDGYAAGHIEGAVAAPYSSWRGPATNPGQLLPLAGYTELLQGLGLRPGQPVVVVADGGDYTDFGAAARVYWTLKWLGLRDLAILNGGMTAWSAAGLAQTRAVPVVAPSRLQLHPDATLLATRDAVARDVRGGALLLDARAPAFYRGEVKAAAAPQPGTIVGARSFDSARWFADGAGSLPDAAALRRAAAALPGRAAGQDLVSFCNTGHLAATNWFVLSELLGQRDVKLYPGSIVDWSQAGEPMDHVPTRSEQLWAQLQQLWKTL
jgi:thiosulfate/3-mercaptopyruvate sulfurtransferase